MTALSSEDSLKLNVLLASNPRAIRIDENHMQVFGYTDSGDAEIQLVPNCSDEVYLKAVREVLSANTFGFPGGYPVFLRNWTRMGQTRDSSVDQLLLLGEPEAIAAVVNASGLTAEQARLAWWCAPSAENARCMLRRKNVAQSSIGKQLAVYLVDYLPFETEPEQIVESIYCVLQPGLLDANRVAGLWQKAQTQTSCMLGFLIARPDDLPDPLAARTDYAELATKLSSFASSGNPVARQLLRVLSTTGQSYIHASRRVLRKPANQHIMNLWLDTTASYFAPIRPVDVPAAELSSIECSVDAYLQGQDDEQPCSPRHILLKFPELTGEIRAMLVLSLLSYSVVRPIFAGSTAEGSLMRRKLVQITESLDRQLTELDEGISD